MTQSDVQRLRDVGYNDEQISLGVQVISYFNYINRIADGLGIDPEPWMTPDPDTWFANKGQFGIES